MSWKDIPAMVLLPPFIYGTCIHPRIAMMLIGILNLFSALIPAVMATYQVGQVIYLAYYCEVDSWLHIYIATRTHAYSKQSEFWIMPGWSYRMRAIMAWLPYISYLILRVFFFLSIYELSQLVKMEEEEVTSFPNILRQTFLSVRKKYLLAITVT